MYESLFWMLKHILSEMRYLLDTKGDDVIVDGDLGCIGTDPLDGGVGL